MAAAPSPLHHHYPPSPTRKTPLVTSPSLRLSGNVTHQNPIGNTIKIPHKFSQNAAQNTINKQKQPRNPPKTTTTTGGQQPHFHISSSPTPPYSNPKSPENHPETITNDNKQHQPSPAAPNPFSRRPPVGKLLTIATLSSTATTTPPATPISIFLHPNPPDSAGNNPKSPNLQLAATKPPPTSHSHQLTTHKTSQTRPTNHQITNKTSPPLTPNGEILTTAALGKNVELHNRDFIRRFTT